jgi:hypothetical protein
LERVAVAGNADKDRFLPVAQSFVVSPPDLPNNMTGRTVVACGAPDNFRQVKRLVSVIVASHGNSRRGSSCSPTFFTRKSRLQPREFLISNAKDFSNKIGTSRLFQITQRVDFRGASAT